MFEFDESAENRTPDGLFMERLEAFMEKSLAEIKAFSERENRPFEETRRYVAHWHCKYLFKPTTTIKDDANKNARVHSVLCDASRILESLYEVSGVHSFLLAVDPNSESNHGFLGGTVHGREFWRGLRGGGDIGAQNFKLHCLKTRQGSLTTMAGLSSLSIPPTKPKRTHARSLKTEVYSAVRDALRLASGVRNAEMKWTNHDRLSVYGVRIVGWPPSIPAQNPSSLIASQNQLLLNCLERRSLRFVKIQDDASQKNSEAESSQSRGIGDSDLRPMDDLSWAYEDPSYSTFNAPMSNPVHSESMFTLAGHGDILLTDAYTSNPNMSDFNPLIPVGGPSSGNTHPSAVEWDDDRRSRKQQHLEDIDLQNRLGT